MAGQVPGDYGLHGNQPSQTLQAHPRRAQHASLVEAQQETDECRRIEAREGGAVSAVAGAGGEVSAGESI